MSQQKKVVIVDYQLGNLFSVKQACQQYGVEAEISSESDVLRKADALILPGVGAFEKAMQNLHRFELVEALKETVEEGKPLFGICLGMQLLFNKSSEFGDNQGLNLIDGVVSKFPRTKPDGSPNKVPQIGWNQLEKNPLQDWSDSPMTNVTEEDYMYLVHSYYVQPENAEDILSYTHYNGVKYCSTIRVNNIFATQYHPEKSAHKGLDMYKNWLNTI